MMSMNFVINWRILKPSVKISKQDQKVTLNKDIVDILSFGNRRFVSSIYWIETLMDSDLKHYKGSDLGNWMFNRFDTITSLDPLFYEAYLFGGIYLSIVKDDENGAKVIYERGLKVFPNDLDLLYNAGFNDFFELDDTKSALMKFDKISASPDGVLKYPFIVSLAKKIKVDEGVSLEEIYPMFLEDYKRIKGNSFAESFYQKTLYGLKAEIDLTCLNSQKTNCSTTDFNGDFYIKDEKSGLFYAKKRWTPFKLRKKVRN